MSGKEIENELPEIPSLEELERWQIRERLSRILETLKEETGVEPDTESLFISIAGIADEFVESRLENVIKRQDARINDMMEKIDRNYIKYNIARAFVEDGKTVAEEMLVTLEIYCDWLYPAYEKNRIESDSDAKPHAKAFVGV